MQQYFHLTGVLGRWLYAARRLALLERATGSKPLRWWLYLAVFRIDFGDFMRTILVGMKGERDDPKEIEGLQALFVVNLAPKKMAGEISEGMLFDIGYADGIVPVLAQPEKPVPDGTRVG